MNQITISRLKDGVEVLKNIVEMVAFAFGAG